MTKGVQALLTALDGRPKGQGGRKCCGLLGFAFTFPFICTLTFSSWGVRGTGIRGCVFTFPFAFAFTFALSFALCPWEGLRLGGGSRRRNQRVGECGHVIPLGGEVVHLKRERACCPRGLAQARGRR